MKKTQRYERRRAAAWEGDEISVLQTYKAEIEAQRARQRAQERLKDACSRVFLVVCPSITDGIVHDTIDRREYLGKIAGRNRACFNEFGGQFLGHLQGFLTILIHISLSPDTPQKT